MKRALAVLVALLAVAPGASAQTYGVGGMTYPVLNPWPSSGTPSRGVPARRAETPAATRRPSNRGTGRAARPAVVSDQALTFRPSLARRRVTLAGFVEQMRAIDPAGADQLQAAFASTDFIVQMGVVLASYGLTTTSIADAYTIWLMNAWDVAQGTNREFSRAQVQAVRAQVAAGFRATPSVVALSDAEKQEAAETYLVQAALIPASLESAAGNPAMVRQVRETVRAGALAAGIDLDLMDLTDEGFQFR